VLAHAREVGDRLIVGGSTDKFKAGNFEKTVLWFHDRIEVLRSIRCVDLAFAESSREQKFNDIERY